MNAPLSAWLPFEVLDDVGHVDLRSIDSRLDQRFVEEVSGRPDERLSLQIFLIAGLLANKHYGRCRFPFAEDGLRSRSPQVASLAAGGRSLELFESRT